MRIRHGIWTFILVLVCHVGRAQHTVRIHDISKNITALAIHEAGKLIYGTVDGELGMYNGVQVEKIKKFEKAINKIIVEDQSIFVLSDAGLYVLKEDKVQLLTGNHLQVLDRSVDGHLLVTRSGLYVKNGADYTPDREEFYNTSDVEKGQIFQVGKDQYVRIGRSIFRKNKNWDEVIIHRQDDFHLSSDGNRLLLADKKGIVRYFGDGSLDTLYRNPDTLSLQAFMMSRNTMIITGSGKLDYYNIAQKNLKNIHSFNTDMITSMVKDRWDNVWVSAGRYLYQIIDKNSEKTLEPPEIQIESITINGKPQLVGERLMMNKGSNDISIAFSGVQMTKAQELTFQTKISQTIASYEGSFPNLNQWSKPSKDDEVMYRNLPAGEYEIQIRASIDHTYYTYAQPKIKVSVADDTVQKIWLVGILGAMGIVLSALFFNNRYNRMKKEGDRERLLLRQENKMLTLQQKALQLQMNPHFVFNALNSIQGLIAQGDSKNARAYLQKFSLMMRSVLNQSREETISLEKEIDYLSSYLSLEQMANNNRFTFDITTDDNVEEDVSIPTMIIQPFIENAILHGVRGLTDRKGHVIVSFVQEEMTMICTVIDNGIGRAAAAKNKKSTHKSVALDVVNERLQQANSSRNPIEYRDIKNNKNEGVGTEVKIFIPIH